MAITEPIAASAYPLDLTALIRTTEAGIRECVLIRDGGIDTAMHDFPLKGQARSHLKAIGLELNPVQPIIETEMISLFEKGVKLVLWKPNAKKPAAFKPSLWASSQAGIWNHVVFPFEKEKIDTHLLGFALNNPNIVHSYSFDDQTMAVSSEALDPMLESLSGYHGVQPLPGVPIWKKMATPEQLLYLLNTFGLRQVQKWLVIHGTNRVQCLGDSIQYHFSHPADLPEGFFEEICKMVEAAGSVSMQKVSYNLERAFLVGYAMEFGRIVGNSSLKEPRPEYILSLNQNTGLDFTGFLERGYTSVRPEYRGMGIGTKLLEGLTNRTQGRQLYSVIAEDNLATQKIAMRNKTRKLTTFFSEKAGKQVGVWVPD